MATHERVPVPKAKVSRPKPSHPSFFEMAKAAISSLADKKGSSVQSIQTYIAGNYNLEIDFVKIHLKQALAKGIENETFVRPKGSDAKGYTGRFKMNKLKQTEEAKEKAKKEKAAAKKEKESGSKATKKTASAEKVKKTKSATKSPKKVVKKKTPTKTASKAVKPSKAMTKLGTPKTKAIKKVKATLKTPKQTPAKAKAAKK